jgi:signal transduction histidine kinase
MTPGIIVLDGAGYVTSANAAAEALLGYQTGALPGHHCDDFWDRREYEQVQGDEPNFVETVLRYQGGRPLAAAVTVTPIHTPTSDGRLLSITALPDLNQLHQSLFNTQRLASIGVIAASVAHELNNPLSIITATCNNLLSQIADETLGQDELLHYLQMIDHSAWRCARLVQTLRSYAHSERPQHLEVDLNKIIEDALTLVAYQFRRQFNLDIETELSPRLKRIVCDPNQITQVLMNLLMNARDASQGRGGGVIRIKSWLGERGAAVAFSVRDQGTGIPAEIIGRLFDPFFTTKAAGEGTGLGLSIAAGIVQQHGGRIEAKNNPEGGATFTVILPCQ